MEEYLVAIVKPLLSVPDDLSVVSSSDAMGVLLTVNVSKYDMPHLIGKEGQNIHSVRKLMGMYGMRHGAKISIKINEPIGGKYQTKP
jgi:predicted RNA-binding protein YlqC (UPF0109 family)